MLPPIAKLIQSEFPDWIHIAIPARSIPTGRDWKDLRLLLYRRVRAAIAEMPLDDRFIDFSWDDIPFPVSISRAAAVSGPACYPARIVPTGRRDEMKDDIRRAISQKAKTLMRYPDRPRALLLDYFDIALLNEGVVADAFRGAAEHSPEVQAIDEVFVVENGNLGANWALPVKLGSRFYPNLEEFQIYRAVQYEMTYGSRPSWGLASGESGTSGKESRQVARK